MTKDRPQHAFTTIELIVVLGVISLIGVTVFMTLSQTRTSQPSITDKMTLQMEARNAADVFTSHIRECSEIVRPSLGETTNFLVAKTVTNEMLLYYLEKDEVNSTTAHTVHNLMLYQHDYDQPWSPQNHRKVISWISNIKFTCANPSSVVLNITQSNKNGEFQFITSARLMNLGDLE